MCRRNISLELFAAIPLGEDSRMQAHSRFCFEWVFASIPSECEAIPLLCSFFFCLSRGVLRGMCPLKINKAISLLTFPWYALCQILFQNLILSLFLFCHSVLVSESHLLSLFCLYTFFLLLRFSPLSFRSCLGISSLSRHFS